MWPAIVSAVGSLLGAGVSAWGQSQAQDKSEKFSKEMYDYALLHGPSLEMQGLKAAGINPMFRYGSGGSSTPVSVPVMNFGNAFGEAGPIIGNAASSAYSAMRTEAETERTRGETKRNTVEMLTLLPAEVRNIQERSDLTEAQQHHEWQRLALTIQDVVLRQAQSRLTEAELQTIGPRIRQMESGSMLNMAMAASAAAEAALRQTDLTGREYDEAFMESWFGEIVRGVHNTIDGPHR